MTREILPVSNSTLVDLDPSDCSHHLMRQVYPVEEFDLIIIGAGSGNMIPGPENKDWKIAIVEKDRFGGTCLNRGCLPSKMLVYTGEVAETIRTSETYGIKSILEGIDWERIDPIPERSERWRSSLPNTTVFKGEGRFVGEKVLEVNGERITAPRIAIFAGSRPFVPPVLGLSDVPYHTSDTVMRLPKQPKSLIILGGGYISAELGHFFGSLGTEITIIDRGDSLIKIEDDDIRHRFTEVYSRKFNVLLNARATNAHLNGD